MHASTQKGFQNNRRALLLSSPSSLIIPVYSSPLPCCRLSHAPKLLCEPLSDLEAQVKHMAVVLSVCNKDAARVLYRVPDVAEVLRDVTAAADLGHPDSPASLLEQRVVALQQVRTGQLAPLNPVCAPGSVQADWCMAAVCTSTMPWLQ